MTESVANVLCAVECYPFEGGSFVLQGGQVKRVTVRKNISDGAGVMFFELAPGGPNGTEGSPTWSQVLTPMSHVLIGMSRGSRSAVVMDGILREPMEAQAWQTTPQGSTAGRTQTFTGADFGWFFKSFNWFALTYYGLMIGSPGFASPPGTAENVPSNFNGLLNQGLVGGATPAQCGRLWYDKVMAGDHGILSNTFVSYPNAAGGRVSFSSAVAAQWQEYPNAFIPNSTYFMTAEESWLGKFRNIFPHPWYEFFVTTAPSGAYLAPSGASSLITIDQGTQFTMQSMPQAQAAGPVLVARVNPTPALDPVLTGQNATPGSIDTLAWNALPLYDFTQETYGFHNSSVGFSPEGARNFYQLNPTAYRTLLLNNANNIPVPFQFLAAADAASVQRYGFRPQLGTIEWLYDNSGNAASSGINLQQTVLSLTSAMISWYHPQPLMARAEVILPLTPDILVGTRFRYNPFKSGEPWDFYIEGFEHNFVFGGTCTTKLTLTRGLPVSVYQDITAGGLLESVHTGTAMRSGGVYSVGLPAGTGPGLQYVTTTEQASVLNGRLSNVFSTGGAK